MKSHFRSILEPGSDEGHPGFTLTYRINMFLYGFNTQAQDHNGK